MLDTTNPPPTSRRHEVAVDWDSVAVHPNSFVQACLDEYSSFIAFLLSVLTLDTFLVAGIAAASPCFFYYYFLDGHRLAFSESWTLISIFLVFPLTMTINSAFSRREVRRPPSLLSPSIASHCTL